MKRNIINVVMVLGMLLLPTQLCYANELVTTEDKEDFYSVTINYPEDTNAQYRWQVSDWCLTTGEVGTGIIGDSVPVYHSYSQTDNTYCFEKNDLFAWGIDNGIIADYTSGEITVFLQPVIDIEKKNGAGWESVSKGIRDVGIWTSFLEWKNKSLLNTLYDIPLTVSAAGKSTVRKVANGEKSTETKELEQGQVMSLSELGVTETVVSDGITYVLSSVEVTGSINCDGKAVLVTKSTGNVSSSYNLTEESQLYDANGELVTNAKKGYVLTKQHSGLYRSLSNTLIRIGEDTCIDAEYVCVDCSVSVYGRSVFHDGSSSVSTVRMADCQEGFNANSKIKTSLSRLGLEETMYYAGTNKWQLSSITIAKSNGNLSGDLGEIVLFNDKTSLDFDLTSLSTAAWKKSITDSSAIEFTTAKNSCDYVVQAEYEIYAPQVELKYYKDSTGELHLFSVTSGGKEYDSFDDMKRNLYGYTGSKNSFVRLLSNQTVDNQQYDLVLTEAYAYEGASINSVKEYLGDADNCWDVNREPYGGKRVAAKIDGKSRKSWSVTEYATIISDSMDAETGLSKTLSLEVSSVPMNPLVYVGIYEACPSSYSISYYTTSGAVDSNTELTYAVPKAGKVLYDAQEYSRGRKVVLPPKTEGINAYLVYSQDGIDDSLSVGDIADGSDLTGSMTFGTAELYCTRYAWVTLDKLDSILNLGNKTTFGKVLQAAGQLEDSILGGKLYFEGQGGILVKIYTPKIVKRSQGIWKVDYVDVEDGMKTEDFTSMKKTYKRLNRAQLTGDFRSVLDNSTVGGSYLSRVAGSVESVKRNLQLVNVGYARVTGDSGTGFVGDKTSAGGGGYTYGYNSVNADKNYAKSDMSLIEQSSAITWFKNVYSAIGYEDVKLKDYRAWLNANAPVESNTMVWHWYVYKPIKSYSSAAVFQDTVDDSVTTAEGYVKHTLSPYTTEYSVSYAPFVENKDTGKVYQLTKIYYGYVDDSISVITEAEFNKLKNSVSKKEKYSGGVYECSLNKGSESDGFSSVVTGNTQVFKVDGEQLHVVAVYEVYVPETPVQENPEVAREVIGYRDTVDTAGLVTDVDVSPSSRNSTSEASIYDARFRGKIINDLDLSSDIYNTQTAIPTTEYLRTTADVPKYLADIDFNKNSTTMSYTFTYYKAFTESTVSVDKFGNSVVEYSGSCIELRPQVTRSNINYSLRGAVVWYPNDVTISNYAIPNTLGQRVTMIADTSDWVNEDFGVWVGADAQFYYPNFKNTSDLSGLVVCKGVSVCESVSKAIEAFKCSDYQTEIESMVGPITATNQQVEFNDGEGNVTVLLQHGKDSVRVEEPIDVPCAKSVLSDTVYDEGVSVVGIFSSKNNNKDLPGDRMQASTSELQIDSEKANGCYVSSGKVRYVTQVGNTKLVSQHGIQYKDVNSNVDAAAMDNGIVFSLDVNRVKILTPVVIKVGISSNRDWNQAISTPVGNTLVLDRTFTINTSVVGAHSGLPGYSCKSYERYLGSMQSGKKAVRIRFPFVTILVSKDKNGESKYEAIRSGEWVTVGVGSTQFILPSFVEESSLQAMEVRAYACNAITSDRMGREEYGCNYNTVGLQSNIVNADDGWTYTASRMILAGIVGRVYGLSIIDIGQYPLWESYFRGSGGILTGNAIYSGLSDENGMLRGNLSDRTFPLVDGDHPSISNEGFMKAGYLIRFKLETIGSMYNADDLISIVPEFYWVDEEGKNRTRVDVYYDDGEQKGIKIGSAEDAKRLNSFNFDNGKFDVEYSIVQRTASILKYSNTQSFTGHSSPVYSLGNIQLNQYNRVFTGEEHSTGVGATGILLNKMIEVDGKSLNVPNEVIARSVQEWYGQYYLPAPYYVTAAPEEVIKERCKGFTYTETAETGEDIWKSDGYLIVNFNVKTVNRAKYSLAYNASGLEEESNFLYYDSGNCNMWDVEMHSVSKTSYSGVTFVFNEGDFLVYDLKDRGKDDAPSNYEGGGTH